MSLGTTIQTDITDIDNFFKKEFKVVETDYLPLAVKVTQYAKSAIATGIPAAIATALASDTDGISVAVLATATTLINKALIVELDLQADLANPSPEEEGTTVAAITTTITGLPPTATSKLWTSFGVAVLNIFKTLSGQAVNTFAVDAAALETVYQKFLADVAAQKAINASPAIAVAEERAELKD